MERINTFLSNEKKTKEHNKTERQSRTSWFQGFHPTILSAHTMGHLSIWGIVMYVYFSIMLGAMAIVARATGLSVNQGTSTLISFVFVEVFPLMLLVSFFSIYQHWLREWLHFFWQDWKRRWRTILTWGMMLFLMQIILNMMITVISGGHGPTQSGNTADLMTDIKKNGLLIVMNLVIAPIFEELVFRLLLTNVVRNLLARPFHDKMPHRIIYTLSAIFSAFIFAALHDGFKLTNILIYMGCALFLQFIQKETRSMTAPIMVHGMSNLFAVAVDLL